MASLRPISMSFANRAALGPWRSSFGRGSRPSEVTERSDLEPARAGALLVQGGLTIANGITGSDGELSRLNPTRPGDSSASCGRLWKSRHYARVLRVLSRRSQRPQRVRMSHVRAPISSGRQGATTQLLDPRDLWGRNPHDWDRRAPKLWHLSEADRSRPQSRARAVVVRQRAGDVAYGRVLAVHRQPRGSFWHGADRRRR